MAKFLFVYHGGSEHPEEECEAVMQAWNDWFDGMGEAVIDAGAPVGNNWTVHRSRIVTSDGGNNPATGYSLIQAEDREAAIELAKGCPIIEANGDIEIAEIIDM